MKKLNILFSAYACNPYQGSEESVGWGWVNAISKYHDLWVITADFQRKDIEKWLAQNKEIGNHIRFYYVSPKFWHFKPTKLWKLIELSGLKPLMNLSYNTWQKDAYVLGKELHEEINFDLIHQLTYVGFRFPGHLWKIDVPFVWGPIGGLCNTPWRLFPILGLQGSLYYTCRNIINSLQKRFLLSPKLAFGKAENKIIAATAEIRKEILRWYGRESEVICEVGLPEYIAQEHSIKNRGEPLRLSWSGLHIPRKALSLLLKALAELPNDINWKLDILGKGPCTAKWRRLSKRLGINDRCVWHEWLPRDKALKVIHNSHIFIITSIEDLTSTVLLEALSQGVPVICPDHCGFSDVVLDDCGVKIPVESPRQLIFDFTEAIKTLARDETERSRLAKGALQRIQDFSWDKKAKKIDAIYRRAVPG